MFRGPERNHERPDVPSALQLEERLLAKLAAARAVCDAVLSDEHSITGTHAGDVFAALLTRTPNLLFTLDATNVAGEVRKLRKADPAIFAGSISSHQGTPLLMKMTGMTDAMSARGSAEHIGADGLRRLHVAYLRRYGSVELGDLHRDLGDVYEADQRQISSGRISGQ